MVELIEPRPGALYCAQIVPSLIALLPNIITSINIGSPDRLEVVKGVGAMTLVIGWALK